MKMKEDGLFVKIPRTLKQRFKMWCLRHHRTMAAAMEALIAEAVRPKRKAGGEKKSA